MSKRQMEVSKIGHTNHERQESTGCNRLIFVSISLVNGVKTMDCPYSRNN